MNRHSQSAYFPSNAVLSGRVRRYLIQTRWQKSFISGIVYLILWYQYCSAYTYYTLCLKTELGERWDTFSSWVVYVDIIAAFTVYENTGMNNVIYQICKYTPVRNSYQTYFLLDNLQCPRQLVLYEQPELTVLSC